MWNHRRTNLKLKMNVLLKIQNVTKKQYEVNAN